MSSSRLPTYKKVLQPKVTLDDLKWVYTLPDLPTVGLKLVTVKHTDITLSLTDHKENRALSIDAAHKFILVSFASFRFPDQPMKMTSTYIQLFLTAGIILNGITYLFYGHGNSQLKSRTCYLYACTGIKEIHDKLNSLGNFSNIMSVGKRAKRIGLLFSVAEMGFPLSFSDCEDIPDVEADGHVFTDGCGFISCRFAKRISRTHGITFHNQRYVPAVMQIRYKGYKGIVILNPALDRKRGCETQPLVQFRDSMRKFKGCEDNTFAIVAYSKPYTLGKLNGELVTLLSWLGIPDEVFLEKQQEYFRFIREADRVPLSGFLFASYCNRPDVAEKLLLDGIEAARGDLKKLQTQEWAGHFDKRDHERVRIMIRDSRLLFGVCDPTGILTESQCQVRITVEGGGVRTLDGAEIIVSRNPCLHPGDIRKLRAVHVAEGLDHLVDCIVFSVQGSRPAASLMSGGDLDGDKFFVCWDKDLIPSKLSEAYDYPPAKEVVRRNITHEDMIKFFAGFNNASLGRVKNCYLQWVRIKGAGSMECQVLNSLFSSCVDGEKVAIPEKLQSPPENPNEKPFILDLLCDAVKNAACTVLQENPLLVEHTTVDVIDLLVSWPTICLSEFELYQLVHRWASCHNVPMANFLMHFDFGAFTAVEKHWIAAQLPDTFDIQCLLFNGLTQSVLLSPADLKDHNLHWPTLHWKRLYSSQEHDMERFTHYISLSLEQFQDKLIVIRVDDRLTIALYVPLRLTTNNECLVDASVQLLGFTPTGVNGRHRASTVPGYRLFFDGETFQLFQGKRSNTFVFITVAEGGNSRTSLVLTSIALQKFSRTMQQHIGFVRRTPVMAAEIYVISNRDRVGHEILNISMNQVHTDPELVKLVQNIPREYELSDFSRIDWTTLPLYCTLILQQHNWSELQVLHDLAEFELLFSTCIENHGHAELVKIVEYILNDLTICMRYPDLLMRILSYLDHVPMIVIPVLHSLLADPFRIRRPDFPFLMVNNRSIHLQLLDALLLTSNISYQNVLPELDQLLEAMPSMSLSEYSDLLVCIPLTTRQLDLVCELLHTVAVDHSPRLLSSIPKNQKEYFTRLAMAITLDRAGEIAELCPCDDWGVPSGCSEVMINIRLSEGRIFKADWQELAGKRGGYSFKKGDHVRLKAANPASNKPFKRLAVLDALVEGAQNGVVTLKLVQPPPPEVEQCDWLVFACGSLVTTKVMMNSLTVLLDEGENCCGVCNAIIGEEMEPEAEESQLVAQDNYENEKMNDSQRQAVVMAMKLQLTLVWGPPGTGKTTVVVEILMELLRKFPKEKLLLAASTHNAVDNVLERFLAARAAVGIGESNEIVRVATEVSKVAPSLRRHSVDAFVGSNLHDNNRAKREAEKIIKNARVIFTTCTGAGLGILRDVCFHSAVIDEASQLTEPNALAPLVKGVRRAILVGDHVQLRPTIRPLAELYQFDVSLFERLYGGPERRDVGKVMLNVQYRMHPLISAFPSREFYNGQLLNGISAKDRQLEHSMFPWPGSTEFNPVVFVPCTTKESLGSASKMNIGQVQLCIQISKMLQATVAKSVPSIAILSPYARQIGELNRKIPNGSKIVVSTIDAFQGREADIVIFTTVRCNAHGSLGFVSDSRRINVALTRAKFGTVIVGDEATLATNHIVWAKLIGELPKVVI